MIQNYIKTAFRNLWKHKGYTAINMLGLAIGMACVMLIMLYVRSEISYEQFHENKDEIYLLNVQGTNPQTGEVTRRAIGPYRLADELAVDFPDFENIIRFAAQGRETVEYGDETYREENLAFVDDGVFEAFTFPLIKGEPSTVLDDPYSIVITEAVATKWFGTDEPVGKVVRLRDRDFTVKGLMEEIPGNSQFDFNILVSMNCAPQVFSRIVLENWGEGYVVTFVQLAEESTPEDYRGRLADFTAVKLEAWKSFSPVIAMHPLTDLYLDSGDLAGWPPGGDRTYVYAFSVIALFILIIACINFMNLATARSSLRAGEVGLRKVVGAERSQLIGQFLSESIIMAFMCLVIAVLLTKVTLPFFNNLADREITLHIFNDIPALAIFVALTLIVGLLAGSYPALLLSRFDPVKVLSGKQTTSLKGGGLRKVLVTFQFCTSIFLLIVTAIVYKQLEYARNVNLGFNKENLVLIAGTPLDFRGQYEQFRNELLSNPKIVNAGGSSRVPPGQLTSSLRARPEGIPEDQQRGMQTVWTDFDFIETLGIEMAAGRSFSRDFPADASTGFILNEAAVEEIGWTNESALNKSFGSSEISDWEEGQWENRDGKVIGVLKNFHFESLREEIIPTVYFVAPYMAWNYVIRIRSGDIPQTIAFIGEKWEQFNPEVPFEYTFVDENFAELYQNEERQAKIFGTFAGLAIFIACLGLIGLASFTAERRKKEVGIRKVLGASSMELVYLLSKEFTWIVVVAFLIAAPVAWMIMQNWMENFAYQANIGIMIFVFAGVSALLVAWLTVGFQTARAAFSNPVKAIQYE